MQNIINFLSNTAIYIVWAVILIAGILIFLAHKNNKYREWERLIESLPSWASTVGVLGTFVGITAGLMGFDASDSTALDKSIGTLLDGLKTAFNTSLIGMFGSWVLSFIVDKLFDKHNQKQPSNETAAILQMSEELHSLCMVISSESRNNQIGIRDLLESMVRIKFELQDIHSHFENHSSDEISALHQIVQSNENLTSAFNTMANQVATDLQNISSNNQNIATLLSENNTHTGEILDIAENVNNVVNSMYESTDSQNEIMRGYIDDLLSGMNSTNQLLTQKFDEFTELMKKSNTEALKEAMESALSRLNEQMSELINRLITDNITKLTECVERLSVWQQENKELIASLTRQYKEMEQDFESTNTTLTGVKDSVETLTSDSGKLKQIVNSLQAVMVDDTRFREITTNMVKASTNNRIITDQFKEEVNNLNEWVRRQRDFADAVNALIHTLNELSEIRNYSDEFWRETKRSMNEGVSIIRNGTAQLNSQIETINEEFYERLGATLSNLDSCIRSIVEQRR